MAQWTPGASPALYLEEVFFLRRIHLHAKGYPLRGKARAFHALRDPTTSNEQTKIIALNYVSGNELVSLDHLSSVSDHHSQQPRTKKISRASPGPGEAASRERTTTASSFIWLDDDMWP